MELKIEKSMNVKAASLKIDRSLAGLIKKRGDITEEAGLSLQLLL
jgi:hypothetical protein